MRWRFLFVTMMATMVAAALAILLRSRSTEAWSSGTSSVVPLRSSSTYPPDMLPGVAMRLLGLRLLTAANAGEVREGMRMLEAAAEGGQAEAQVSLGRIYLQGLATIPKDFVRARRWFDRAFVEHRHPSAAYFLGTMLLSGQAGKADPVQAVHYLQQAAEGGLPQAMFLLATVHAAGTGVPQDVARAVAWYEKAAELEYAPALQTLGMAYQYGELGLAPDEAEARRYFLEAEHAIKHASLPP